jgi:hypothetical protein
MTAFSALSLALGVVPATASLATVPDQPVPSTFPPADGVEVLPDQDIPGILDGDAVVDSWALTPDGADESTRTDLSYTGAPGDVINDVVTLWNLGTRSLDFDLYATDGENNPDGTFALLPSNVEPIDIGTWIAFPQDVITVPAKTKVSLPIIITIPDDARSGDHIGGVLAANTATDTDGDEFAVNLERRTGTRVYLRVDGPIRNEVAIEEVDVSYSASPNPFGGSASVSFRIQNRGNVRVDGTYDVSVEGPFGIAKQTASTIEFPELLPGQGIDVSVEIDGVPALLVANGVVAVTPTGGDRDVARVSSKSSAFAPPFTLMLLLLAAVAAFILWRRVRKHRRGDAPVVVAAKSPAGAIER